jgi:lipopolysaccharide transport protein LptA
MIHDWRLIIEKQKQSTIETMTIRRLWSTIRAVLLIFFFLASPGFLFSAEPEVTGSEEDSAAETKIRITADRLESDHEKNLVEFSGNVVATEDDVLIEADRMKIFYTPSEDQSVETGKIEKIVSEGNVKIVFDGATKTAVADKAVYLADKKVLELSGGDPRVWSGKNMIRGKKITVFQAENRSLVEGDDGDQVEATLFVEEGDGLGQ